MAFNGNFCIEDDSDEIDAAAVAGLRQAIMDVTGSGAEENKEEKVYGLKPPNWSSLIETHLIRVPFKFPDGTIFQVEEPEFKQDI